jgi:Ser/Thr protein kinase RdoA (MazF antagonist)
MKNRILRAEEISSIRNNYGLNLISQLPFRDGNNAETITKIKTTSKKDYVVKIYEPYFPRELIEFHAKVSNHLNRDEIPAPKVLQNKNRSLVTSFMDRNYIIMSFLPGQYPKKDAENTPEIVFSTLAKVLKSLSKFKPETIYEQEIYKIPLSKQLKSFQDLLPNKPRNSVDEYVLAYQERLSKLVHSVERKVDSLKIPTQIIMGDFNLETLLVSDSKVTGVLDFDFVHKNRKIFDVIHTIDLFCIDKETEEKELDKRVDWNRLERCMKAYSRVDKEIYSQIEIAPLMLQLKGLSDIIRVWKKGYEPNVSDKEKEYFKRRIKFFVYRTEIATKYWREIIHHLKEGYKCVT